MTKVDWGEAQARRVGETVRTLRGPRSGKWLEEETSQLGHRVSRTTISELETGKRKDVSLAELVVIAAALGVPPALLIYPGVPDVPVDVLPGIETTSGDAYRWFTEGNTSEAIPLPPSSDSPAGTRAILARLDLTRERAQLRDRLESDISKLRAARQEGPNEMVDFRTDAMRITTERLENVDQQLQSLMRSGD